MSAKFPFVLDGFPRTGSTTLTRILQLHPEIECCMEPFHPKRYGGSFNHQAQANGMEATLKVILLRWNGLKHIWEPGNGWPFLGRPELNDELVRNAEIVVSLRRRNLLQQYVSGFVSKHLGFWVGTAAEFRSRLNHTYLPPLDVNEVSVGLNHMMRAITRRDELLDSLPCEKLTFYYEDIFDGSVTFESQKRTLNALFSSLGHSKIEDETLWERVHECLDPQQFRWASNEVYSCIPGAKQVDEHLSSHHAGRLFI
jgi:hypothetical protein